MLTIHAEEMKEVLSMLFLKHGFSERKANLLAEVHTENTLHGVNSHGINRVPQFVEQVKKGLVKVDTEAEKIEGLANMERWDGKQGSGIINAVTCTHRAITIAKDAGMGLVALRNTNHWMRGGFYGWQAAKENCIAILFTNTKPNMPAWGATQSSLGNNPLVVSIPRKEGHIVLDMALSQCSFGQIIEYRLKGEQLPFPGGFDEEDNLSTDPVKILKTETGLPIGYWKGSAFSMVLDMLATLLSGGNSTYRISLHDDETAISQIYLCIDPTVFPDRELQQSLINEIIQFTHESMDPKNEQQTYFPGERSGQSRKYNAQHGMKVDPMVWKNILTLSKSG
jgi:3-dehydro-L-gulonate 2-dehydrogenase